MAIRSGSSPSVSVARRPQYAPMLSSESITGARSRTSSSEIVARRAVGRSCAEIHTNRSAWGNGSGRRNIASKTENTVVFAAMPRARQVTATAVNSRSDKRLRMA
jgi:hypothetical protein